MLKAPSLQIPTTLAILPAQPHRDGDPTLADTAPDNEPESYAGTQELQNSCTDARATADWAGKSRGPKVTQPPRDFNYSGNPMPSPQPHNQFSPQTQPRSPQWDPSLRAPQKSRAPLWIAIAILALLLVIALTVVLTMVFGVPGENSESFGTDDEFVLEDPPPVNNHDDPALDPYEDPAYETSWTVEDLMRATCPAGGLSDGQGGLPNSETAATCFTNSGVIEYATYSSQLMAENDLTLARSTFSEFALEPLEGESFLLIAATQPGMLEPLNSEYRIMLIH